MPHVHLKDVTLTGALIGNKSRPRSGKVTTAPVHRAFAAKRQMFGTSTQKTLMSDNQSARV